MADKIATIDDIVDHIYEPDRLGRNRCVTPTILHDYVLQGETYSIEGSYADNRLVPLSKISFSAASGELGDDEYEDITPSPTNYNYVIKTGSTGSQPSLTVYFETESGRTGHFSLPGGSASSNSTVKRNVDYRVGINDNLARIYRVTQADGTDFRGLSYCSATTNDASTVAADKWVRAPSEKKYADYGHLVFGNSLWQFKCTMNS